ncbi:MAG TPA: hypothetical protein VMV19_05350 [Xanthobacteraceae bacterium]|nr:hypothetical protein [Xanthobacteraceae bacterium]
MRKPVPDKAEVAVEYPDKLYIGTFEHSARFDAHFEQNGISLSLYHSGSLDTRKTVRMHFHCALFAEILRELAKTAASLQKDDIVHREELREAAESFYAALKPDSRDTDVANLSPDEEVRLLHIME